MSGENIENMIKSINNFAVIFVDHHVFPDVNFNGHCLINNNISVPEKVINLYISKSMVKKFKHRFYIKELFI